MPEFLQSLPTVLVLGALVAIFLSLQRQTRTPRVRLWVAAWGFVLIHFLLPPLPYASLWANRAMASIWLASVLLAGYAFLLAVSDVANIDQLRRRSYLLAVPMVVYSALLAWHVDPEGILHPDRTFTLAYMLCAFVTFVSGIGIFVLWHRKLTPYVAVVIAALVALTTVAILAIVNGRPTIGYSTLLVAVYALSAVFFVRRYPRLSSGVVLTAGGFLAWSTVWGVGAFGQSLYSVASTSEITNVPQYFVAIGMIVTLLEEETILARIAGDRERDANRQLQRFADVTSKLLTGVEVKSLSTDIARVIAEVSNFERVAILLTDDKQHMYIGGHAGITQEVHDKIALAATQITTELIDHLCAEGRRVGQNSYICSEEHMASHGAVATHKPVPPNDKWNTGDELLVPLRTGSGNMVGCISLDTPRDVERVTPEELSKIEMLAADLAVAIENSDLQRKLVTSEKLASVGQLVSGMAHEINNPLTAVMGYSELLQDLDTEKKFDRELSTIRRESLRMKAIIENLVRFAKQAKTANASVEIPAVLDSVLRMRGFDLDKRGISVERNIAEALPPLAMDQTQLKTVLVNVINNSIDALQDADERRVIIDARPVASKVVLSIMDTGSGFTDPGKVFDPFYTTKAPGKGTGLGLSICYGIIKQQGGEITCSNIHPHGARVTIEIPIAQQGVVTSSPATANAVNK